MDTDLGSIYLDSIKKRFSFYQEQGEKAMGQLTDAQLLLHQGESNSIAVIIRHISGNLLSRFSGFMETDGEKSWRQRDEEFREAEWSRDQLTQAWNKGWDCLSAVLDGLKTEDLLKTVRIRGEELSVIDALNRQLSHHASHIGQIIYAAKEIRGKDWQTLSIPRDGSRAFNDRMMNPERK